MANKYVAPVYSFICTYIYACGGHTCCNTWGVGRGAARLLLHGEMTPVAVGGVVTAVGSDACVDKVGDDVDVGESAAEGASPRLPEEGAILDLADDVLDPLPHRVELAVVCIVSWREATFDRSFLEKEDR